MYKTLKYFTYLFLFSILFSSTYEITIVLDDPSRLFQGSKVLSNQEKIGKIKLIEQSNDGKWLITLKIYEEYKDINSDMLFGIEGSSLFIDYIGMAIKSRKLKKIEEKVKAEADKIMIKLISLASNNTIDDSIKDSIDKLYLSYPNSEAVNYLGLLSIRLDSLDSYQRINSIKNNITNEWFKTQAFLISGDYYSDKLDYESAKEDYQKAIEYASSNAQNGYCYYKLGNIYFEMNNFDEAREYYKEADEFFNLSKESESLERDAQFQDWDSRNKIALHRTENLLKK